MKQYPSQEKLRELFEYNCSELLTWKEREEMSKSWNSRYAGTKAGSLSVKEDLQVSRTVSITLGGKRRFFTIQSLVWIYFKGEIPSGFQVYRKDSHGFFQIENLELRCRSGEGRVFAPKNAREGSGSKFIGVCASKNGLFWIGGTSIIGPIKIFFTEIDAATHYDNICFSRHSSRPNATDNREVIGISRSLGNHIQNGRRRKNAGQIVGVFEDKRQKNNRYYVRLGRENLGKFQYVNDAARAYNVAAKERYGEHAVLNDIPNPLGQGDIF